ncbi:MAG TPA: hypothetical protein VL282_03245 [Tepidisphaeraceae bacterium]|jgi:predicted RNA-binding Zn-ribbon protein involved in translation (DUF1610 family)|nr:hypothetical protein [Tepidisphaeraceae bacterium]
MTDAPAPPEEPADITCPACGASVAPDPDAIALHCGNCGHEFFIDSSADEQSAPAEEKRDEDALDAVHIRQRLTLVRSAYRSRSYAIIAMCICAVLLVQAIITDIHQFRAGAMVPGSLYAIVALVAAYGTIAFFRRALLFHREAKQTALHDPNSSPDFSNLGDGSQRWRNLEDIR